MTAAAPIDVTSPFRLYGRVAIVTGASSGLGRRFARVLHAAGATVVVGARRIERLRELADELGGDRVVAQQCDVVDDDECARLVDTALNIDGHIDVVVNNAGMRTQGPAETEPIGKFRDVVGTNLTAAYLVSQLAGRHMIQQRRGSIVNVASVLGMVASTPLKGAAYCASKGGLINLTRELAAQWARKGVRVNALAPGMFASEMSPVENLDDDTMRFLNTNCPMARIGQAHELDGALLFLASDASSYVTGHTLTVDGGWTAR